MTLLSHAAHQPTGRRLGSTLWGVRYAYMHIWHGVHGQTHAAQPCMIRAWAQGRSRHSCAVQAWTSMQSIHESVEGQRENSAETAGPVVACGGLWPKASTKRRLHALVIASSLNHTCTRHTVIHSTRHAVIHSAP